MSKQTRRLTLAATRIATTADALGESFARALGQVLRAVERRLSGLITDVQGGSRTALVQAAQVDALRRGIRSSLFAAGYDELARSAMGARLDTLTTRVLQARRLAKQSAELVGPMTARLIALREVQLSGLLDEGDALAQALSQSAMRGLFGARDVNRILDDLGLVVDRTEAQIRTLYDTSVSVYGRAVEAVQAGDDPDTPFAYMGPVDAVTRPFCLQHVGKVYTRAQIDELDNGQLGDVFLTGGGYNCRHVWTEVSKFSALLDLGARQRVPEIAEQVRERGRRDESAARRAAARRLTDGNDESQYITVGGYEVSLTDTAEADIRARLERVLLHKARYVAVVSADPDLPAEAIMLPKDLSCALDAIAELRQQVEALKSKERDYLRVLHGSRQIERG